MSHRVAPPSVGFVNFVGGVDADVELAVVICALGAVEREQLTDFDARGISGKLIWGECA